MVIGATPITIVANLRRRENSAHGAVPQSKKRQQTDSKQMVHGITSSNIDDYSNVNAFNQGSVAALQQGNFSAKRNNISAGSRDCQPHDRRIRQITVHLPYSLYSLATMADR